MSGREPVSRWLGHPLARRLKCIACEGDRALELGPKGGDPSGGALEWSCPSCGARFAHADDMPVLVPADLLPVSEVYSEDHPVPLKDLRRRRPEMFQALKSIYRGYARFEAALSPSTALEPAWHLARMRHDLPVAAGRRVVLDVGGGSAPYRSVLGGEADAWVVLEKDRAHARELAGKSPEADFLVGAGEGIPILSDSCDLVVLTEVLEHCNRPKEVLSEIARVLKPGGHCVGTVPQYWHVHGWPSDYFRYTMHGLEFLASEAGLEVVRMDPKGGPVMLMWAVADLTTSSWSRLPGVALLTRIPSMWVAWGIDRALYRNPKRMKYPDTAGWAFLFRKPASL
jgi:SAM-dependent methyltransferase